MSPRTALPHGSGTGRTKHIMAFLRSHKSILLGNYAVIRSTCHSGIIAAFSLTVSFDHHEDCGPLRTLREWIRSSVTDAEPPIQVRHRAGSKTNLIQDNHFRTGFTAEWKCGWFFFDLLLIWIKGAPIEGRDFEWSSVCTSRSSS